METNHIKKKEKKTTEQPVKKGWLVRLLNPDISIDKKQMPHFLPFILYLTFWAIFYIANTHYAEKSKRDIDRLNKELKELRADYLTVKAELMYKSKQSEVAKKVAASGLKELTSPPKKIVID